MVQKKILKGVFILALVLLPQILFAQRKGLQPMIYGEFDKHP